MPNNAAALQVAQDNYCRLLVMCTQITAPGSTQASIDAIIAAAEGANIPAPKINSAVDGDSYDWVGYQIMLTQQIESLQKLIVILQGPFAVISRARY